MSERTVLDLKLDRSFDMLDANGDGRIGETDVISLAAKLGAAFSVADRERVDRLQQAFAELWASDLAGMDADGDGRISREEWRAGLRGSVARDREGFLGRMATMTRAWLALCDSDGDGHITRTEYVNAYTATLALPAERLHQAFTALDADGDGILSGDELINAVDDYYASEDPDAPGNQLFGPLNEGAPVHR